MSHAASTVNIVTTDGAAGRAGVTVSAMSSVSADGPSPTLLVCVHHLSPAAPKILKNGAFCVNVLRDDQSFISDTFAGRFKDQVADKFDCADWAPMPSGALRVVDPLVGFDCTVSAEHRVGTHHVFVGEVGDVFLGGRGSPLLYANRGYGAAERIEAASSIAAGQDAAANKLNLACFHTFGPFVLPQMIARLTGEMPELEIGLVEGNQRRVQESLLSGEAEVGLLYDTDLAEELAAVPLTQLRPYVLLAADHPLADKSEIRPDDLSDQSMILFNAAPSRDHLLSVMSAAGLAPNISYRSTNFEMVRGLVGNGLGYAVLATKPASDVTYDGRPVVARPLVTKIDAPSSVVLATLAGADLTQAAERFIWFARDHFDLHQ